MLGSHRGSMGERGEDVESDPCSDSSPMVDDREEPAPSGD
jgi:hypothetical protein